jgi:hypothetical protein
MPPNQVVQSLSELIDLNYKLIVGCWPEDIIIMMDIYKRYGKLDKFRSVFGPDGLSFFRVVDALQTCNTFIPTNYKYEYVFRIERHDESIKCDIVKKGSLALDEVYTFAMLIKEPLTRVWQRLTENGILSIMWNVGKYTDSLPYLRYIDMKNYMEYVQPRPFTIYAVRILYVFKIYGGLVLFSIFVLAIELFETILLHPSNKYFYPS